MLKFYYSAAPNPTKIALFLEEAGMPYDAIPVDTRKGDQHKPEYLAINPNAKVPAIVDGDAVACATAVVLEAPFLAGRRHGVHVARFAGLRAAAAPERGAERGDLNEAVGHRRSPHRKSHGPFPTRSRRRLR